MSRSYARGMQAGLLFLVIPAYSALANRIEPARLVKWIFGIVTASRQRDPAAGLQLTANLPIKEV